MFFVCVFALFLFFDGFMLFLASFSPFSFWPCEKLGNLEIRCRLSSAECCGVLRTVLLSAAGKSNSHLFCICFVCVSHCFLQISLFFPIFWWICWFFFASFSPFSPVTLEKVRKPWNWLQIEHCWMLLSAVKCCWVCCWVLLSVLLSVLLRIYLNCFVCVCFPIVFVQISLFFRTFGLILWYLLGSFSALSPAKTQETSNLVVDWELLSTAGKCNPSFQIVVLKFSLFLSQFLMGLVIFAIISFVFQIATMKRTALQ